jgi:hypothetical protein
MSPSSDLLTRILSSFLPSSLPLSLSLICLFSYSILHSEDSILRQMKVGQSKLHMFPNAALRQGMEAYMADLT